jgi:hypothetical protein
MPDYSCNNLTFSTKLFAYYEGDEEEILPSTPSLLPDTRETRAITHLLSLIGQHAPHLRESFVSSPEWWRQHWGTPEAHVRSS